MKKLMILLLMLLLLCGCKATGNETIPTSEPETAATGETTVPTESWVEEYGTAWDRDGVLVELPWGVSGNRSVHSFLEYDGDLLLWSYDTHLENEYVLELCLLDLDEGMVIAQRDVSLQSYTTPQLMDDALYLCDNTGGVVLELNKELQTVKQWKTLSGANNWYMGADEKLYQVTDALGLWVLDMKGDCYAPLIEGDPEIWTSGNSNGTLSLEYYHPDTGETMYASLDLKTGELLQPEYAKKLGSIQVAGDIWMSGKYNSNGYTYYLGNGTEKPLRFTTDGYFELTRTGYLLEHTSDGMYLHLYDQDGKAISSCQLSETGNYSAIDLIWNEKHQGYFVPVSGYDEGYRLLFWDTTRGTQTEDLVLAEVPEPSEAEKNLKQRCEELGAEYGIVILTGEDCDTEFWDFTASIETDWEKVSTALDVLEQVLEQYPAGFFRQLHYGDVHGVRIQLVSDLIATGNGRSGDGYVAFVENRWDYSLMVVDIDDAMVDTYYHEFSHVIDAYLEWDSMLREDALYSASGWESLNPSWFSGYTYDYSSELYLDDYTWFVDSYSTISPTEDRARVMEYAMAEYGYWTFAEAQGLWDKLDYYSRCIRDAFDTTGWPETTLWEQYLG